MAYGDSPFDADLRANWESFCDQLKAAGNLVFKDSIPPTAIHRADGFRYLTQNLGQAFALALETKNTKYPMIHAFSHPTLKLAGDNADCIYLQAWIDGETVYKISGNKGTARFWNITVHGPRSTTAYGRKTSRPLHEPFGDTPEANIFGHQLKTDWDGNFELFVGGERQGDNWLPTTSGSRKLFMRQCFDDWSEISGQFRIERVGMDSPKPMPTPQELIDAMKWAGTFVYDIVEYWPDHVFDGSSATTSAVRNQFPMQAPPEGDADVKDRRRGRLVAGMPWSLADDEALILEFDNYDAFWMLTCESAFTTSMDFLYRPVSFTPSRTAVDSDGKVRLVVTRDDPGLANWVDNQGCIRGSLTFRSFLSTHMPELRTKVVKAGDIARHLPADTKRVTAEERVVLLHQRFDAIRRRYRL